MTKRLRSGSFEPLGPAGFWVSKPGGGNRLVSSFAIADEVISSRLYRSLVRKNQGLMSARSYAYRSDIGVYDAVAHLSSEWRQEHRVFVAEYDFHEFFESIDHAHIYETIENLGLVMTSLERQLVRAFLQAPLAYTDAAGKATQHEPRTRGLPLGTSISLFLANVAASPLDRALERLGVGFARYADDTVIWSRDYAAICRAVDELHRIASVIGSPINQEKSKGVSLLVSPETQHAEFKSTSYVEYLGHSIGLRSVRMRNRADRQIRAHVTSLLYNNLLREPLAGTQDWARLGVVDRDYVSYIWQLRRYLYGHLNENEVRRLNRGPLPPVRLSGVMSRYSLTDDDEALRALDQWIATQTWLTVRKRARLLRHGLMFGTTPALWSLSREKLIDLRAASATTGSPLDLRMPSVLRMAEIARKSVRTHGFRVVSPGADLYGARVM